MYKTVIAAFALVASLVSSALAAPDAIVVRGGDLRIRDAGCGLVFPDGSIQTKATVSGPTGPTGSAGPPGPANRLAIGSVQAGTQAAATITGTAPNQTLNLTLPQGPKGDTGPQGPACSPLGITCNLGEVFVQTETGIQCGKVKFFSDMMGGDSVGICVGTTCILSCSNGRGDCDANSGNGCETLLSSDSSNCGACNNACNVGYNCSEGACVENVSSAPPSKIVKGPVAGALISFAGYSSTSISGADGAFARIVPGVVMTSTGGTYFDIATMSTRSAPTMKAPAAALNITALTTVVANAPDQASANALIVAFQKLGVSYDAPLDTVSADGTNRSAIALNEIIGELINNNAVSATNVTSFLTALVSQIEALPAGTNLSNPDSIVVAVTTAAGTVPAVNTALTASVSGGTILNNIVGTIKLIPVNNPLPGVTGGSTGGTGGSGTTF